MLQKLEIKNYAIIDEMNINFHQHFNIITGETGAGKSILLGALSLVLGKRADTSVLRNENDKCVVEAWFNIDNKYKSIFEINDVDFDTTTIIRREINSNGKSRAFINDTPCTLQQLQEVTNHLINIHAQGETQKLLDDFFFCNILDSLANQQKTVEEYQLAYKQYKKALNQLNHLKATQAKNQKEQDFLQFQIEEFNQLSVSLEDYDQVNSELLLLQNAESIQQQLNTALQHLDEGDFSVLQQLSTVNKALSSIASYNDVFSEININVFNIQEELNSIVKQINQNIAVVEYNPNRYELLQEQVSSVNKLMLKHQVNTVDELLQVQQSLQAQLNNIDEDNEQLAQLEISTKKQFDALNKQAISIAKNRQAQINGFEKELTQLLHELGMEFAVVQLQLNTTELNAIGNNIAELYFSPNKGIAPNTLNKVGSGGEKSRLMLAIKSIEAKHQALPTMIFDEIDTGISGEVANRVGKLLQEIGKKHQIIAITHLPQVAAKAHQHFFIYKNHDKSITYTNIKVLDNETRIHELAVMLSGDNPNQAAIENAKILLQ
ncbi:MAG: DNA repair protein RecN [Chitinophagales bacterium]|nr:DNA repair protein RecN [Chitinophagales bacterium]